MIEAQEMDPAGPNHEELRGGLLFPLRGFRRFGFQTIQFDTMDESVISKVYFEVCVLIGP